MVYLKDSKGRLLSLNDVANIYKVPLKLIQGRYNRGIREIKDLTQDKYEMLRK